MQMLYMMRQEAREAQAMQGAEPEDNNDDRVTFDEFIALMQ